MESIENIDLHKYWCVLKRRWLPAVATISAVVTLTYLHTSSKVPIYSAQGQLLLKQDKTSSLIQLNSANSQNTTSLETEVRVISSTSILQKALYQINQSNLPGTPINLSDLQQGLEITNIDKTDVLQIDYTSTNPKLAALVVNQLMQAYVDNNLSTNRAAAISAGNFISGQLPKVRGNVARADAALRSFKEKNKITDLEQTQELVAANMERIGSQIDSVEAQIADLNSRSRFLQTKLRMRPQQVLAVSSLSQSPAVQATLGEFQDLQRKLADARSRYQEANPVIVQLKDKEVQLKTLLQAQVAQVLQGEKTGSNQRLQVGQTQQELMSDLIQLETNRIGLVTQMTALSKQRASYQQRAATLPRLEQEQRQEQRELSAAESTYETLLKNLQEIKVIENRTVGNVQIIETAEVATGPINANNTSAMLAGILAGVLVAAGVVYILEIRDKKIKTVKEARELFEYTLLGTIPIFSKTTKTANSTPQNLETKRSALPVLESPRSSISESYRMLHANLNFVDVDKALKVIVVTSSVPKEGKSTTCANLAAAMTQLDYRVLVIDADIRSPSQHHIWQIGNEVGLMNVIAGQTRLNDTVIETTKNLYILTAGVSTSNLDVILDSRKIAVLLNQWVEQYDYIIIDTPPLAITADACVLGKMADGVLLVTRPGLADSITAKLTKEYLEQSGQNILGIVVNGVLPANEPHSYYHYTKS